MVIALKLVVTRDALILWLHTQDPSSYVSYCSALHQYIHLEEHTHQVVVTSAVLTSSRELGNPAAENPATENLSTRNLSSEKSYGIPFHFLLSLPRTYLHDRSWRRAKMINLTTLASCSSEIKYSRAVLRDCMQVLIYYLFLDSFWRITLSEVDQGYMITLRESGNWVLWLFTHSRELRNNLFKIIFY